MPITLKNIITHKNFILILFFFIVTLATRFAILGNPFISGDEEFYLFVGGRILQGDLPYVDVWDRKPIGLFLIYAFFHLFGEWRFIAYQMGAILSVTITTYFIAKILRLISVNKLAPFIGGTLYIFLTAGFRGVGGQSPIFYNLFIAWAGLLITQYLLSAQTYKKLKITGLKIMVLLGLAIQIKYTVIFEGCFMGVFLLYQGWKNHITLINLSKLAFTWIIMALLPTLLVILFYTLKGYGHDWYFANVTSIFLKNSPFEINSIKKISPIAILLFITLLLNLLYIYKNEKNKQIKMTHLFLYLWVITAFISILILKSFSYHYFLPIFVPFSIITALLWSFKTGKIFIILTFVFSIIKLYHTEKMIRKNGDYQLFSYVSKMISAPHQCFFFYNMENIFLDIDSYCPLTKFTFSGHLSSKSEKNALGINTLDELKKNLMKHPYFIVTSIDGSEDDVDNTETDTLINTELKINYKEIYRHKADDKNSNIIIYQRVK